MADSSSAEKSCERTAVMSLAAWHHDRQSRMGVFCVSRTQIIRVLRKERENWWGTETKWKTDSSIITELGKRRERESDSEVQVRLMKEQKLNEEEIKIIAYSKSKFKTTREGLREREQTLCNQLCSSLFHKVLDGSSLSLFFSLSSSIFPTFIPSQTALLGLCLLLACSYWPK